MDPTREYYAQRLGILWKVVGGMEKKSYHCDFLKNLSVMNGGGINNKEGVVIATYPVALSIQSKGKVMKVPLFVKETRAGYHEQVPYNTLMELYILKNYIYRMFSRNVSPHFAFPVYQLVLDTGFEVGDQIIDKTTETIDTDRKLCPSTRTGRGSDDMAVYSFTEHLDPRFNISMFEFSTLPDSSVEDFRACMFQILYNLACLEDVKLRHGDLHLKNIMVSRMYPYPWTAKYSLEGAQGYILKSPVFIYFIDFDRSSLHGEDGDILTIPDSVLEQARCVTADFTASIPNGVVEDCWKTWNPYADFTRMISHLLYQWKLSPRAFDILFPDYALKVDVVTLLGDFRKNLFGRPSIDDIRKTVDGEVLERTTPKMLFRRFADQFINLPGEFSVMRTASEVPYPSFGISG